MGQSQSACAFDDCPGPAHARYSWGTNPHVAELCSLHGQELWKAVEPMCQALTLGYFRIEPLETQETNRVQVD
jgi:hypothetical protein